MRTTETPRRLIDQARAHNAEHRADPAAVRAWVAPLLDRVRHGEAIPHAGSSAWQDLSDSDHRKLAAVVLCALSWLDENTPQAIAARLAAELDQIDRAILERQKATSTDVSATFGDQKRFCYGPGFLELELRRARPRPFLGRPVDLAPHEIDRINRLTEAVWLFDQLMLDPSVSVRDAQLIALSDSATTEVNAA